jgi:transposase
MIRLTDEQWERIRKHFPEEHIPDGRAGRMPIPTRHVLEAVLWILNTGAQWHMLPQSYPNYKTVHRRFQTWCRNEIWRRVLTDVANELRDKGALDEKECFIDATFVMAKGGGSEIGPTKRGKGMKITRLWIAMGRGSRSARTQRTITKSAWCSSPTMVEQILSSHPQISAGGELPFILEISNVLPRLLNSPHPYPEALTEIWMADQRDGMDYLRDSYLRRARQFGVAAPYARWFTDKAPLNETHLGLIGLMFPESPLIHVLRHPLDVMLSCGLSFCIRPGDCRPELRAACRSRRTLPRANALALPDRPL